MAGWRPVVEMQYDAFSYPCLDQLITHVGRYRWRTGGAMGFPLVIRMPYGGGVRAPELHDDSPESYYVHAPGVKLAVPATAADAKGLLAAAIRDPDPVVVLEPKLVYRTARGSVPEGEHVVELGRARVAREGSDLTLVAWGAMVAVCERAAEALAGEASLEVLDLRTLKPLDEEALLAAVARTRPLRRRPGGSEDVRLRLRGRGAARRAGDPRPPWARPAGHRLRRAVPVLAARGLVHAVGRARPRRGTARPGVLRPGPPAGYPPRVAYEFKLPDLGEGLTEAEIARWLVAEGEEVREDQPLVEVQTDKTTVEIPSPRGGTVLKVLVGEGDVAPVGAVLVVIGEEGEQLLRAVETPDAAGPEAETGSPLVVVPPELSEAVRATPAVRRVAKELGVALTDITGTGPGGRIVEGDVRAAAAGEGVAQRVPVRGVRRMIVEQVTRAHREVPAVTFVEECDFGGVDLSRLVALSIHASAAALGEFPEVNARLVGDEIVLFDRVDVGIAVQTDEGLIVPVVRGCERRSVDEIDAEVRRLADGARAGTSRPRSYATRPSPSRAPASWAASS